MTCGTRRIYRYEPSAEPGLRAQWWSDTAGPHLDPLEWAGPADPVHGFPWPVAAAPDFDVVNNGTNVNDSTSGAGAARYGIISGWVFLPDGVTHWRDNNANTGELGMVLTGDCCGGALAEQAGGNHTQSTFGGDRTLMDAVPVSAGWHYVVNPQSDSGAFQGLDLEYSVSGDAGPWINVAVKQPEKPVVQAATISCCQDVPEGWSVDPLSVCCQPIYSPAGGTDEDAVQALIDASAPDVPVAGQIQPINPTATDVRTTTDGASGDFADADHVHGIVRQANPGDPTVTAGGTAALTQSLILDRRSLGEVYSYTFRNRVNMPVGQTWGWLDFPVIVGFQQPKITPVNGYRITGNPQPDDGGAGTSAGATAEQPVMGEMWGEWSSTRRAYTPYLRRFEATSTFVEHHVEYWRL